MRTISLNQYYNPQKLVKATQLVSTQRDKLVSGKNVARWDELSANDIKRLQGIESELFAIETTRKTNAIHSQKLQITAQSMEMIRDVIVAARHAIMQASNPVLQKVIALDTILDGKLHNLENVLNSTYNNQFLFSGTKINVKPVQYLVQYSNLDPDSNTPTSSYYYGNYPADQTFTAGDREMQYAIGAMHLIKNDYIQGNDLSKSARIGMDWLEEAQNQLELHITNLGFELKDIIDADEESAKRSLYLQEEYSKIIDLDLPSAMIELQSHINIANAAYSATAKIKDLNLLKYV